MITRKKTVFWIFIFTLIILCSVVTRDTQAYRTVKPQRITKTDAADLTALNDAIEQLWFITNGRYNFDVVTAEPSVTASEGLAKVSNVGGVYKLHIYINGAWRSWTSD